MKRGQRGLTLIELLLTVVIFSLVVGIFSQALYQVGLFERASMRAMGSWNRAWTQGFALDDALRAQASTVNAGEMAAQGDGLSFRTGWITPDGPLAGRPRVVRLELQPQDSSPNATWGLNLTAGEQAAVQVARWPAAVRFRYLDGAGHTRDNWPAPPTGGVDQAFPSAVQLVDADNRLVHQWNFFGLVQPGLAAGSGGPLAVGGAP